jgi:hypothetical protein
MKNASRTIAVSLAVFCMMAAGIHFMNAQTSVKPPSDQATSNVKTAPPNVAQLQATAEKSSASIQASSTDKQAMVRAVRTKNTDIASTVLLRNGFTAKQLQGAKIELVDKTGGGGSADKTKITIRVDCCPLVITITISL